MRRLLAAAALALAAAGAHATFYCDTQARLSADQKDKLLRFAAVIKGELDRSGASLALIARSGLDLSRFQVRYSHAGLSLKASPDTPWAVRQLYFACDEGKPLIFDQGLAAFLMGTDQPELGYISVLLLPPQAAADLERSALDRRQALLLLGGQYSANAYPFNTDFQNCNQWLAELLASAWRSGANEPGSREDAQAWLRAEGYAPSVIEVGWPLMWFTPFVPFIHRAGHPQEDLAQRRFRVSMPASIEAFVRTRWPAVQRLEFCHNSRQVVVHQGWLPLAEGCEAGAEDRVIALD